MESIVTFDQLIQALEQHKVPFVVNRKEQAIELGNTPDAPAPLILRWEPSFPVLHFVQFLFSNIPDDRIAEIETAIVRLNCSLKLPIFGFEHATRRLYSRISVAVLPGEGISMNAFGWYRSVCVEMSREHFLAFKAVIDKAPGSTIGSLP